MMHSEPTRTKQLGRAVLKFSAAALSNIVHSQLYMKLNLAKKKQHKSERSGECLKRETQETLKSVSRVEEKEQGKEISQGGEVS